MRNSRKYNEDMIIFFEDMVKKTDNPEHAKEYQRRADIYRAKLQAEDAKIQKPVKSTKKVTATKTGMLVCGASKTPFKKDWISTPDKGKKDQFSGYWLWSAVIDNKEVKRRTLKALKADFAASL